MPSDNENTPQKLSPELARLLGARADMGSSLGQYSSASLTQKRFPVRSGDSGHAPKTDAPPSRPSTTGKLRPRPEAPKPTPPKSTASASEKLSPELARLLGSRADRGSSSGRYSSGPSATPGSYLDRLGQSFGKSNSSVPPAKPSAKPKPVPSNPNTKAPARATRPKATVETEEEGEGESSFKFPSTFDELFGPDPGKSSKPPPPEDVDDIKYDEESVKVSPEIARLLGIRTDSGSTSGKY